MNKYLVIILILLLNACTTIKPTTVNEELTSGLAYPNLSTSIGAPSFFVGDTWKYRNYQPDTGRANQIWEETVKEVRADSILMERKRIDRKVPPSEEWRREDVNKFPIFVGKKWRSPILRNGEVVGEENCEAIEWVEVSTKAGKFNAIKYINIFHIPEGDYQQIIWYSPTVRNFVKLVYVNKQGKISQVQNS